MRWFSHLWFLRNTQRIQPFRAPFYRKGYYISFPYQPLYLIYMKKNSFSIGRNDKTVSFRSIEMIDPSFLYRIFHFPPFWYADLDIFQIENLLLFRIGGRRADIAIL